MEIVKKVLAAGVAIVLVAGLASSAWAGSWNVTITMKSGVDSLLAPVIGQGGFSSITSTSAGGLTVNWQYRNGRTTALIVSNHGNLAALTAAKGPTAPRRVAAVRGPTAPVRR
jgi:hypothetical protein